MLSPLKNRDCTFSQGGMRGEGGAIGYVNGKHEAEALKTRLSRYIFRIAGMQTDKKNRHRL